MPTSLLCKMYPGVWPSYLVLLFEHGMLEIHRAPSLSMGRTFQLPEQAATRLKNEDWGTPGCREELSIMVFAATKTQTAQYRRLFTDRFLRSNPNEGIEIGR